MKKLTKLDDFKKNNFQLLMSPNKSKLVIGGIGGETHDMCSTMNDTCVNNCSDIYQHAEVDGKVLWDITTVSIKDCK
jgi:hypothetical protein